MTHIWWAPSIHLHSPRDSDSSALPSQDDLRYPPHSYQPYFFCSSFFFQLLDLLSLCSIDPIWALLATCHPIPTKVGFPPPPLFSPFFLSRLHRTIYPLPGPSAQGQLWQHPEEPFGALLSKVWGRYRQFLLYSLSRTPTSKSRPPNRWSYNEPNYSNGSYSFSSLNSGYDVCIPLSVVLILPGPSRQGVLSRGPHAESLFVWSLQVAPSAPTSSPSQFGSRLSQIYTNPPAAQAPQDDDYSFSFDNLLPPRLRMYGFAPLNRGP